MAEKHVKLLNSTATWQFFLQQLWNFVQNTQASKGILQFATDGSYYGIKSGGSIVTDPTSLSSGFGSDNDYIVIEPALEYPGGDRWQIMFKGIDVSSNDWTHCSVEISYLGGWTQSGDGFGSNQTSGAIVSWTYSGVTNDKWYISCANTDTYINSTGEQTYTYIRILLSDDNIADGQNFIGVYCGGYIPSEPDNDTKPIVGLFGICRGYDSTNYWGKRASVANRGIAPGNYAHNTDGGNVGAFINITTNADEELGFRTTRSDNWANDATLILDYDNSTTLGAFGKYTQLLGHQDRADMTLDSNAEYMVVNDQVIRWKPSV